MIQFNRVMSLVFFAFAASTGSLAAQSGADTVAYAADACPSCAGWNEPTPPVRLFGNTYYVGTRGLAALLITSPQGHVLIDAGLPESAMHIVRNIRALGFDPKDIKKILNSHAHYDHAGGTAAIQRLTGAVAAVSPKAVEVLRTGKTGPDDPQFAIALPYPPVRRVEAITFGDTLRVGTIRLVAHQTAGHAPGGTSWTWQSCANARCVTFVYADSQTPVSADDFFYSRSTTYPQALRDFERGFATLEQLRCDVLITPHPGASNMWNRVERRDGAELIDGGACKRYVATARTALKARLEREGASR